MPSIRIYDNSGSTVDRYTVIYPEGLGLYEARAMDENPTSPQGFGQFTLAMPGRQLGDRIRLTDLPQACQRVVLRDLDLRQQELSHTDYDLTQEQIEEKHNPNGGGQHPQYTRSDWKTEVENDGTSNSYWGWVHGEIESERCDLVDVIDAGLSDPEDVDDEHRERLGEGFG
jgi:hypothetical protein